MIAQYNSQTDPGLIRNDDILSLFTDCRGIIWVGSSSGLFSLEPISSDSVNPAGIDVQGGLPNFSIHTISQDFAGSLWITTNQGLSMIDSTRRNVQSFNMNDGLINFEYSDGASYFDKKSSRLLAGGTMGVDIVQTDSIHFSSYFPPIAINRLLIRNVPVSQDEGSVLYKRINLQDELDLKYSQNSLSFNVSPLAYWGRERHRISFRLLNYSDDWVILLPDQPLAFSGLKPGNYTLQLRVSDENGIWSDVVRRSLLRCTLRFG